MKRFILTIISSCAMLFALAQEEIVLDTIPKFQNEVALPQLHIEKPLIFDDSFNTEGLNLFDQSLFNQPLFSGYNKNLDFLKYLNNSRISTMSHSITYPGISPFYSSGIIYNQSIYQLNNRLSVGGNSFGAQSIFEQPRLNPTIQDMNTKGASMFLQYKVSKSFKVEGRVSISNRSEPWMP
jgi:hypothetical protein